MIHFDESDQAGTFAMIYQAHLNREDHNGQIQPECLFCKNFLIVPERTEPAFSDYKMVFLDTGYDETLNIKHVTPRKR